MVRQAAQDVVGHFEGVLGKEELKLQRDLKPGCPWVQKRLDITIWPSTSTPSYTSRELIAYIPTETHTRMFIAV